MRKFETGKIHKIIVPAGEISNSGQCVIQGELIDASLSPLPDGWEWQAKVGGRGEYVGSFCKRLAKYQHKVGRKVTSDFLGKIGSIIAQHTLKGCNYFADFTQKFDWCDGDFGDDGSCFWGSNCGAKDMLRDAGAYAVRFYREQRPNCGWGRAWLLPHGDGWACFNGYGIDTPHAAQVVAIYLDTSYKHVLLKNNGSTGGLLWINSGAGYLIAPEGAVQYNDVIDFRLDEICQCAHCGEYVGDTIRVDGSNYCEDCLGDLFSCCVRCDEWTSNDDVTWVDDDALCTHCLEVYYLHCEECGEWYHADSGDITEVGDRFYCNDCRDEKFDLCYHCGEWVDDYTEINVELVCEDCLDRYTLCDDCMEYIDNVDIITIGDSNYCSSCADTHCCECGEDGTKFTVHEEKWLCDDCLSDCECDECSEKLALQEG